MNPTYLVYDLETVPDLKLFRDIKYPGCTTEDAVKAWDEKQGQENAFIPHTFHIPVSIAVLKVGADYRPMGTAQTIKDEAQFFEAIDAWSPILVDYNGSGFDLSVLTCRALAIGIQCPRFFAWDGPMSRDYRYRYSKMHIDLQDWIGAYGRVPGGLNLMARLSGGTGKDGMDGSKVAEYYASGYFDKIDEYCRQDVKETYRIFLRTRVLMGKMDARQEQEYLSWSMSND